MKLRNNNLIYVKVYSDSIWCRNIKDDKEVSVSASKPFTTDRLLIGNFDSAEKTLKSGIKKVYKRSFLLVSPFVVIQPLDKIDGGLSQVEERLLTELSMAAGAQNVVVWVGSELTDQEVIEKGFAAQKKGSG